MVQNRCFLGYFYDWLKKHLQETLNYYKYHVYNNKTKPRWKNDFHWTKEATVQINLKNFTNI